MFPFMSINNEIVLLLADWNAVRDAWGAVEVDTYQGSEYRYGITFASDKLSTKFSDMLVFFIEIRYFVASWGQTRPDCRLPVAVPVPAGVIRLRLIWCSGWRAAELPHCLADLAASSYVRQGCHVSAIKKKKRDAQRVNKKPRQITSIFILIPTLNINLMEPQNHAPFAQAPAPAACPARWQQGCREGAHRVHRAHTEGQHARAGSQATPLLSSSLMHLLIFIKCCNKITVKL